MEILTENKDYTTTHKYWNKLKQLLKEEGNETVTNCHQLKLCEAEGKMPLTDKTYIKKLFHLIENIPITFMSK